MKKFLEVLLDDNGEMHISAEDLVPEMEDPGVKEKTDALFKAAIKALVKTIWKNQDLKASKAIRILSMAEMACDRQPYQHVDQFVFTMIDNFLPHYEKDSNYLKAPDGFRRKEMIKPFSMGDSSMIQLPDYPFRKKSFFEDLPL